MKVALELEYVSPDKRLPKIIPDSEVSARIYFYVINSWRKGRYSAKKAAFVCEITSDRFNIAEVDCWTKDFVLPPPNL